MKVWRRNKNIGLLFNQHCQNGRTKDKFHLARSEFQFNKAKVRHGFGRIMVDISSASKANKGLTFFPSPFHILGVHPTEGVWVVLCRLPIKLSGAVTHDCYVSRAPGGGYSYSIAAIVCRTQYLDSYWSAPDPKGVLVCIEAARSLRAMVCYRGHSKH